MDMDDRESFKRDRSSNDGFGLSDDFVPFDTKRVRCGTLDDDDENDYSCESDDYGNLRDSSFVEDHLSLPLDAPSTVDSLILNQPAPPADEVFAEKEDEEVDDDDDDDEPILSQSSILFSETLHNFSMPKELESTNPMDGHLPQQHTEITMPQQQQQVHFPIHFSGLELPAFAASQQQQQQQQEEIPTRIDPAMFLYNNNLPLPIPYNSSTTPTTGDGTNSQGQEPNTLDKPIFHETCNNNSVYGVPPAMAAAAMMFLGSRMPHQQMAQNPFSHFPDHVFNCMVPPLATSLLPPSYKRGIGLALDCDGEQLSEYQMLVRQQLEIFEAGPEEVDSNTQGRKKHVSLGQVGLRCKHCAPYPARARGRGAVYYPAKLQSVYQAAQNMACSHLCQACHQIPAQIKQNIKLLKQRRDNANGGKQYWADGCRALGVYETDEGLKMGKHHQS